MGCDGAFVPISFCGQNTDHMPLLSLTDRSVTSMLFCGFLVEISSIPVWLRWLNYLSFIKYGYALTMQNQYEDRVLALTGCTPDSFCPSTGKEVLDFYGVNEFTFTVNFVILLGLIVGYRCIAYYFLLIRGPKYDLSV